MPIVSSAVIEDAAQIDGRRFITERHTDHLAMHQFVRYLADAGADVTAALSARVAMLDGHSREGEIALNVQRVLAGQPAATLTTAYSTFDQLRVVLRALYQAGSGEVIGRMAVFFQSLTDAQLRSVFSITQGQVAGLRTRLQARIDALNALLALVGE